MYTHVKTAEQLMRDNMLVKHLAGSLAYGTSLPTSDVDHRGVFCAEPINLLTPFYTVNEVTDINEEDTKLYELAHFMKLCLACNPNIVETLWVDEEDITFTTPAYEFLRSHRSEFLSSKIAFTTSGYALAQLKRIKGHNKWLTNPQSEEPPRQIDFVSLVQNFSTIKMFKIDLKEYRQGYRLIPYGRDIYGLAVAPSEAYETFSNDYTLNTVYEDDEYGDLPRQAPLAIVKFNKEEYKLAKEKHSQYKQIVKEILEYYPYATNNDFINNNGGGTQAYDYGDNVHPPTYPDGFDVEIFSFKALEIAWNEAELLSEREHVTPYIWKNPSKFKL
ncbi:hypothetical protein LCGC14_1853430, partial [marine sediment metagenome]